MNPTKRYAIGYVRPRGCSLIKNIALVLVFCLLFQEFSYASPQELKKLINLDSQKPNLSWAKKLLPEIPQSVASIEDAWQVPQGSDPSGTKTVILIQDAHTNSSCQLNESKLFDILFEHGITDTVFTEAAKGNVNLTFLRDKASLPQREQIAKEYLQKGLLHGIEYLDLTSNHNFKVEGVEDPDLYFKSLQVYKDSVKKRDSFERYLNEIDSTIDVLRSKLLNPFLLNFLQTKDKQKDDLSGYIQTLINQANTLKIDLSKYPNLKKLNDLKSLESKIDFKQATQEQQKAVQALSAQDQKELKDVTLSKLSMKDSQRGFFLLLEEKLNHRHFDDRREEKSPQSEISHFVRDDRYPNLSQYFQYLDRSKSLSPKDILQEQRNLEEEVLKALTTNQDEEKLLLSIKTLAYYKKLFYLSLTPEEYQEFNHTRHFEGNSPRNPIQSEISHFVRNDMSDLKVLSGFLNLKLMNLKDRYDKAIFLKEDFTDIQNLCTQFYELTYQRDKAFLSNLLKAVENKEHPQGTTAAGDSEPGRPFARSEELHEDKWAGAEAGPAANTYTLITGGYHTPNLKYLLRQQNISYISIVPQVTHETNIKRYEEIILDQPLPQNLGLKHQTVVSKMIDHPYAAGVAIPSTLAAARLAQELEAVSNSRVSEAASLLPEKSLAAARLAADTSEFSPHESGYLREKRIWIFRGLFQTIGDWQFKTQLLSHPKALEALSIIASRPEVTPNFRSMVAILTKEGVLPTEWWKESDEDTKRRLWRILRDEFLSASASEASEWNAYEVELANGKTKIFVPYIPGDASYNKSLFENFIAKNYPAAKVFGDERVSLKENGIPGAVTPLMDYTQVDPTSQYAADYLKKTEPLFFPRAAKNYFLRALVWFLYWAGLRNSWVQSNYDRIRLQGAVKAGKDILFSQGAAYLENERIARVGSDIEKIDSQRNAALNELSTLRTMQGREDIAIVLVPIDRFQDQVWISRHPLQARERSSASGFGAPTALTLAMQAHGAGMIARDRSIRDPVLSAKDTAKKIILAIQALGISAKDVIEKADENAKSVFHLLNQIAASLNPDHKEDPKGVVRAEDYEKVLDPKTGAIFSGALRAALKDGVGLTSVANGKNIIFTLRGINGEEKKITLLGVYGQEMDASTAQSLGRRISSVSQPAASGGHRVAVVRSELVGNISGVEASSLRELGNLATKLNVSRFITSTDINAYITERQLGSRSRSVAAKNEAVSAESSRVLRSTIDQARGTGLEHLLRQAQTQLQTASEPAKIESEDTFIHIYLEQQAGEGKLSPQVFHWASLVDEISRFEADEVVVILPYEDMQAVRDLGRNTLDAQEILEKGHNNNVLDTVDLTPSVLQREDSRRREGSWTVRLGIAGARLAFSRYKNLELRVNSAIQNAAVARGYSQDTARFLAEKVYREWWNLTPQKLRENLDRELPELREDLRDSILQGDIEHILSEVWQKAARSEYLPLPPGVERYEVEGEPVGLKIAISPVLGGAGQGETSYAVLHGLELGSFDAKEVSQGLDNIRSRRERIFSTDLLPRLMPWETGLGEKASELRGIGLVNSGRRTFGNHLSDIAGFISVYLGMKKLEAWTAKILKNSAASWLAGKLFSIRWIRQSRFFKVLYAVYLRVEAVKNDRIASLAAGVTVPTWSLNEKERGPLYYQSIASTEELLKNQNLAPGEVVHFFGTAREMQFALSALLNPKIARETFERGPNFTVTSDLLENERRFDTSQNIVRQISNTRDQVVSRIKALAGLDSGNLPALNLEDGLTQDQIDQELPILEEILIQARHQFPISLYSQGWQKILETKIFSGIGKFEEFVGRLKLYRLITPEQGRTLLADEAMRQDLARKLYALLPKNDASLPLGGLKARRVTAQIRMDKEEHFLIPILPFANPDLAKEKEGLEVLKASLLPLVGKKEVLISQDGLVDVLRSRVNRAFAGDAQILSDWEKILSAIEEKDTLTGLKRSQRQIQNYGRKVFAENEVSIHGAVRGGYLSADQITAQNLWDASKNNSLPVPLERESRRKGQDEIWLVGDAFAATTAKETHKRMTKSARQNADGSLSVASTYTLVLPELVESVAYYLEEQTEGQRVQDNAQHAPTAAQISKGRTPKAAGLVWYMALLGTRFQNWMKTGPIRRALSSLTYKVLTGSIHYRSWHIDQSNLKGDLERRAREVAPEGEKPKKWLAKTTQGAASYVSLAGTFAWRRLLNSRNFKNQEFNETNTPDLEKFIEVSAQVWNENVGTLSLPQGIEVVSLNTGMTGLQVSIPGRGDVVFLPRNPSNFREISETVQNLDADNVKSDQLSSQVIQGFGKAEKVYMDYTKTVEQGQVPSPYQDGPDHVSAMAKKARRYRQIDRRYSAWKRFFNRSYRWFLGDRVFYNQIDPKNREDFEIFQYIQSQRENTSAWALGVNGPPFLSLDRRRFENGGRYTFDDQQTFTLADMAFKDSKAGEITYVVLGQERVALAAQLLLYRGIVLKLLSDPNYRLKASAIRKENSEPIYKGPASMMQSLSNGQSLTGTVGAAAIEKIMARLEHRDGDRALITLKEALTGAVSDADILSNLPLPSELRPLLLGYDGQLTALGVQILNEIREIPLDNSGARLAYVQKVTKNGTEFQFHVLPYPNSPNALATVQEIDRIAKDDSNVVVLPDGYAELTGIRGPNVARLLEFKGMNDHRISEALLRRWILEPLQAGWEESDRFLETGNVSEFFKDMLQRLRQTMDGSGQGLEKARWLSEILHALSDIGHADLSVDSNSPQAQFMLEFVKIMGGKQWLETRTERGRLYLHPNFTGRTGEDFAAFLKQRQWRHGAAELIRRYLEEEAINGLRQNAYVYLDRELANGNIPPIWKEAAQGAVNLEDHYANQPAGKAVHVFLPPSLMMLIPIFRDEQGRQILEKGINYRPTRQVLQATQDHGSSLLYPQVPSSPKKGLWGSLISLWRYFVLRYQLHSLGQPFFPKKGSFSDRPGRTEKSKAEILPTVSVGFSNLSRDYNITLYLKSLINQLEANGLGRVPVTVYVGLDRKVEAEAAVNGSGIAIKIPGEGSPDEVLDGRDEINEARKVALKLFNEAPKKFRRAPKFIDASPTKIMTNGFGQTGRATWIEMARNPWDYQIEWTNGIPEEDFKSAALSIESDNVYGLTGVRVHNWATATRTSDGIITVTRASRSKESWKEPIQETWTVEKQGAFKTQIQDKLLRGDKLDEDETWRNWLLEEYQQERDIDGSIRWWEYDISKAINDEHHTRLSPADVWEAQRFQNRFVRISNLRGAQIPKFTKALQSLGVGAVDDATGNILTVKDALPFLDLPSIELFNLPAPPKDGNIPQVIAGVNSDNLQRGRGGSTLQIFSPASCTTNAGSPEIRVLQDAAGAGPGQDMTVHPETSGEQTLFTEAGSERAISATAMLQTSTGFKKAISQVIPQAGEQDGFALRVPTGNGSILRTVIELERPMSQVELENAFRSAAEGKLKGILSFRNFDKSIGTTAVIGDTHTAVVVDVKVLAGADGTGNVAEVFTMYDNVWAFPRQKARTLREAWLAQREALANGKTLEKPIAGEAKEKAGSGPTRVHATTSIPTLLAADQTENVQNAVLKLDPKNFLSLLAFREWIKALAGRPSAMQGVSVKAVMGISSSTLQSFITNVLNMPEYGKLQGISLATTQKEDGYYYFVIRGSDNRVLSDTVRIYENEDAYQKDTASGSNDAQIIQFQATSKTTAARPILQLLERLGITHAAIAAVSNPSLDAPLLSSYRDEAPRDIQLHRAAGKKFESEIIAAVPVFQNTPLAASVLYTPVRVGSMINVVVRTEKNMTPDEVKWFLRRWASEMGLLPVEGLQMNSAVVQGAWKPVLDLSSVSVTGKRMVSVNVWYDPWALSIYHAAQKPETPVLPREAVAPGENLYRSMATVKDYIDQLPGTPGRRLQGKKVYVRVDYNVPMEKGVIKDDLRIQESLTGIEQLRKEGAVVVLMSHLGRPQEDYVTIQSELNKVKNSSKHDGEYDPKVLKAASDKLTKILEYPVTLPIRGPLNEEAFYQMFFDKKSLGPVAKHLSDLLGVPVQFPSDQGNSLGSPVDQKQTQAIRDAKPGDIILLENTRFDSGEETNNSDFVRALFRLDDPQASADLIVNNAAATAHRNHASNGPSELVVLKNGRRIPRVAGDLLAKELSTLGSFLDEVKNRPDGGQFVLHMGGSKVSDKMASIEGLVRVMRDGDSVLVDGRMAYPFLAVHANLSGEKPELGSSLAGLDNEVASAQQLINNLTRIRAGVTGTSWKVKARTRRAKDGTVLERYFDLTDGKSTIKIYVPIDHDGLNAQDRVFRGAEKLEAGMSARDVGQKTIDLYKTVLKSARLIFWNGPPGQIEKEEFRNGMRSLGETTSEVARQGRALLGGGDTMAATKIVGFDHELWEGLTGGGASLEYLANGTVAAFYAIDPKRELAALLSPESRAPSTRGDATLEPNPYETIDSWTDPQVLQKIDEIAEFLTNNHNPSAQESILKRLAKMNPDLARDIQDLVKALPLNSKSLRPTLDERRNGLLFPVMTNTGRTEGIVRAAFREAIRSGQPLIIQAAETEADREKADAVSGYAWQSWEEFARVVRMIAADEFNRAGRAIPWSLHADNLRVELKNSSDEQEREIERIESLVKRLVTIGYTSFAVYATQLYDQRASYAEKIKILQEKGQSVRGNLTQEQARKLDSDLRKISKLKADDKPNSDDEETLLIANDIDTSIDTLAKEDPSIEKRVIDAGYKKTVEALRQVLRSLPDWVSLETDLGEVVAGATTGEMRLVRDNAGNFEKDKGGKLIRRKRPTTPAEAKFFADAKLFKNDPARQADFFAIATAPRGAGKNPEDYLPGILQSSEAVLHFLLSSGIDIEGMQHGASGFAKDQLGQLRKNFGKANFATNWQLAQYRALVKVQDPVYGLTPQDREEARALQAAIYKFVTGKESASSIDEKLKEAEEKDFKENPKMKLFALPHRPGFLKLSEPVQELMTELIAEEIHGYRQAIAPVSEVGDFAATAENRVNRLRDVHLPAWAVHQIIKKAKAPFSPSVTLVLNHKSDIPNVLSADLAAEVSQAIGASDVQIQTILLPSAVSLDALSAEWQTRLSEAKIRRAAPTVGPKGRFTGQVSAVAMRKAGIPYAVVPSTDPAEMNNRILELLEQGVRPIILLDKKTQAALSQGVLMKGFTPTQRDQVLLASKKPGPLAPFYVRGIKASKVATLRRAYPRVPIIYVPQAPKNSTQARRDLETLIQAQSEIRNNLGDAVGDLILAPPMAFVGGLGLESRPLRNLPGVAIGTHFPQGDHLPSTVTVAEVGHQEARQSDKDVALLSRQVLNEGKQLLLVTHVKESRWNSRKEDLKVQLQARFSRIKKGDIPRIIIGFEVSADNPNKAPEKVLTLSDITEMMGVIREFLAAQYGVQAASQAKLGYGGSLKNDDIVQLFHDGTVQAVLLGGLSLKSAEVVKLIGQIVSPPKPVQSTRRAGSSDNSDEPYLFTAAVAPVALGILDGARLATDASAVFDRGEQGADPLIAFESEADKALDFLVNVFAEQSHDGFIAVGSTVYSLKEEDEAGVPTLFIRNFKEEVIHKTTQFDKVNKAAEPTGVQYKLSPSDLRPILHDALRKANEIHMPNPDKKVLLNLRLDDIVPKNMRGLQEVIVPLLMLELERLYKKEKNGLNSKIYIDTEDVALKGLIQTQLDLKPELNEFVFFDAEAIHKKYSEYAENQVNITAPGFGDRGFRNFYVDPLKEGDIPNFRALFGLSLAVRRIDELDISDKDFERFREDLEYFLGRRIESLNDFREAIVASLGVDQKPYSFPHIVHLDISEWFKGARLARQMSSQSA